MKRCTLFCHEDGRKSVAIDADSPHIGCEVFRGMSAGESITVWCDNYRDLASLRSIVCQEIKRNPRRDVAKYLTSSEMLLNGYVVTITASKE